DDEDDDEDEHQVDVSDGAHRLEEDQSTFRDSEFGTSLTGEVDEEKVDESEVIGLREQLYGFYPEQKYHNTENRYGSIFLPQREEFCGTEGKSDGQWLGENQLEIVRGEIDEEDLLGETMVEYIKDSVGSEHKDIEVDGEEILEHMADGSEDVEILKGRKHLMDASLPLRPAK
ncbi:hypothetical protein LTR96_011989, partial [Exophiala xenobiotica]